MLTLMPSLVRDVLSRQLCSISYIFSCCGSG